MPAFHHRRLAQTRPVIDALRQVARAHGAEPSQVALAWLTQFHGDLVFAIPGASRRAQAETNAGALELKLTPEELRAIDEVSWRLGSTAQRPSAPSGQSHASV
jgi:aryl-alcohol dehydrogenase-like predicted oxidoreductase